MGNNVHKALLQSINLILLVGSLLASTATLAQQLAFPGAEGGGRFAVGGRGGTVYEVTNLNDSGPGSLRDAVSQANRTVVFRVSGIIHLNSPLTISKNNITIAGQTAPGDGICLTGYTFRIRASDIIVRYIRSRLSDVKDVEDDAMNCISGNYQNIIIDHCSLSWSVDETGTFYDIKNFTLQWCLLSESLYSSVHGKGNHGYAGIWGGDNSSFHHNLLAHHTSRNPRFGGSRYSGQPDNEIVDFRNNVIYNWGNGNSAYGGEGGHYNMVNNYYKAGPATPGNLTTSSSSNRRNRILQYTSYYYSTDAAVYPDTLFGGKFYIEGNYVHGYPDVTADNWTNGVQRDSYVKAAQLLAAARQNSPFATPPVTTQTAEDAYLSVLENVGAVLPKRDVIDQRIIYETKTGTATFEGSAYAAINTTGISHPSGIIDTQADVGGLPVYNSTTALTDTDQDGMPDAWEIANALNPNDASDGNGIGTDGYTNLENYLNSIVAVVDTNPNLAVLGLLKDFNQTLGAPSSIQRYAIFGVNLTNDIIVTPPANYEISGDGGTTWHSAANPLTVVHTPDVTAKLISVRLNSSAVGAHNGNISHTSTGTSSVMMPLTGTASEPSTVVSETLLHWPFATNAQDNAGARSVGVAASTPTLSKLYVSNGTTVASVPAYSTTHGQAISPAADGSGLWTTASGGNGGSLNRRYYEQFTVTAQPNYDVRIDSIILKGAYHNTPSNTRFAIVYSKSGFTTADSTDITGGIGPDGTELVSTSNGAYNTPVLFQNETSGTSRQYRFALAGANGVMLNAGQTLTIRFYFSCGSTSSGRYAKLKDVHVKGLAEQLNVSPSLTITQTLTDFSQAIGSPSGIQTYTVAGSNLTGDVTITPPLNFEVSSDNGVTWKNNASPLILPPSSGTLASSTISVRLNAGAAGLYSGMINHTSTGITTVTVPVSGTTSGTITSTSVLRESVFKISPNPVKDNLIIEHSENARGHISIYNVAGVKISTHAMDPALRKQHINVADLAAGVYLIECKNKGERVMLRMIKH